MNHLADATSPYLRQHRENPVDWYPWGDEAFALAKATDKPLLISIGYSACHWCHVMAHESFEDEATAAIINEHFVAIKVDREERPDVDAIYMEAISALTGHGGWPLNVFTTSDGQPFFGGTYFPPENRHGMSSFSNVLIAIHQAWLEKRDTITEQANELTGVVLSRLSPPPATGKGMSGAELLEGAVKRFTQMYDRENGGIGGAPKFPQTPMLELMLRAHTLGYDTLDMVETSLSAMASGGLYDQLGGGFSRYSVDAEWQIPHFEKMLYDQAGLIRLYLHTWQLTGDVRWRQIVDESVDYVLRDLLLEGGGIACAEDADSEGEEGKFYAFSKAEFDEIVGDNADEVGLWYGVSGMGNFEHATNVLHRLLRGDIIRPDVIEQARQKLFDVREKRVRPGRDDKVLTEWNAMFGSALCEVADATGNEKYGEAALRIANFLLNNLRRHDGRWLRSWRDGKADHLAVAADYAWLVDFFTRLSTMTGENKWIGLASETADQLLVLFGAPDGGLFTTGSDAESLVVRPRETYDGVTPSAGSTAANALIRLAALTDTAYAEAAVAMVMAAGEGIVQSPVAFSYLVNAALSIDQPPIEIVIIGDLPELVGAAKRRYLPNAVIDWAERAETTLWKDRIDGYVYVCRYGECLTPVTTSREMYESIDRAQQSNNR